MSLKYFNPQLLATYLITSGILANAAVFKYLKDTGFNYVEVIVSFGFFIISVYSFYWLWRLIREKVRESYSNSEKDIQE